MRPAALIAFALALFGVSRLVQARSRLDSQSSEGDNVGTEFQFPDIPESRPEFASFDVVVNTILPSASDRVARVTSGFDDPRSQDFGGVHHAIDIAYAGKGPTHPAVFSPIDGQVTFAGGLYGTVKIQALGYSHEFLHLDSIAVSPGQFVRVGDQIGTMGGRGPLGANQYAPHVHYQIKDSAGNFVNPLEVWNA